MLIVRETFTARPGMASKLAKLFVALLKEFPRTRSRVLTDFVGPFNTVIFEMEIEKLDDFETLMKEFGARPEVGKLMEGYTDMYLSGRREIYRVVD